MNNTPKVWIVIIAFFSCLIFSGYFLGGRPGLLFSFLVCVVFAALFFLSHNSHLMEKLGAQELVGQDPWNLNIRAEFWAHRMNVRAPRIFLIETPASIIFSAGHPWQTNLICISEGLLKKLSFEEVEALFIHQICHVARMDHVLYSACNLLSQALVLLGDILDKTFHQLAQKTVLKRVIKTQTAQPFQTLLSPIAWLIIRIKVRQVTFFENDDMAAEFLPDRKILAQALWKLEVLNQARPFQVPACCSHLFAVSPFGAADKNWFSAQHPNMNIRIRRLVGYEPL